jgi:hypothetical protein
MGRGKDIYLEVDSSHCPLPVFLHPYIWNVPVQFVPEQSRFVPIPCSCRFPPRSGLCVQVLTHIAIPFKDVHCTVTVP